MKRLPVFAFSLILLFFFLAFNGCSDQSANPEDSIPIKPVVKVTNTNYDQNSFIKSFPDSTSLASISSAYSGKNYSEKTKIALNDYMLRQVKILVGNTQVFEKIQSLSGCTISGEYVLPTYAEKAKYNGKDAWIFQITTGLGAPQFAHFKCFVFGTEKFDTLNYLACK